MARKRTLAVLVGAGASLRAGAPSTQELFEVVLSALPSLRQTILTDGISKTERVDLAKIVKEALAARSYEVDYEMAMGLLEELYSHSIGARSLYASVARLEISPSIDGPLLSAAYANANDAIVSRFIENHPTHSQLRAREDLHALFVLLSERSRIVLASLNYDAFLDDALPWFDGFSPVAGWPYSRFDPATWLQQVASRSRDLLLHLHGSIRYGFAATMELAGGAPFGEPVLYRSAEEAFASTRGKSVGMPTEGGSVLQATPIISGGHKSPKMMQNARPYAYYNATALEEIAEADSLLIVGYGFRDAHVNAWIDEHMRLHSPPRVAVVTRRAGKQVGGSDAIERFLIRRTGGASDLDHVYEPVSGGAPPRATHARIGDLYLVTTGLPMEANVRDGLMSFLFQRDSNDTK
jgi:hypothetical protein